MPRPSPVELAQRRKQITELYLRGNSQAAIAEKLGIPQSTVSRNLKKVCQEWRASSLRDFNEARGEVLRKLDRIERAAWEAWEASRAPGYAAQYTTGDGKETVRKNVRHREGDTKYLDVIHKCLAQRRALLGLDPQEPQGEKVEIHIDTGASREYVLNYFADHAGQRRLAEPGAAPDPLQPGDVCPGDEQRTLEVGPAPGPARPDAGAGD